MFIEFKMISKFIKFELHNYARLLYPRLVHSNVKIYSTKVY